VEVTLKRFVITGFAGEGSNMFKREKPRPPRPRPEPISLQEAHRRWGEQNPCSLPGSPVGSLGGDGGTLFGGKGFPNPLYDNHVFSKIDLQRIVFDKWKYWWLIFVPTKTQISTDSNDVFHFKVVGGHYYLWKTEKLGEVK